MKASFDQFIRSISLKELENRSEYPFSLKAVSQLDEIEIHPKVTFVVGENGSGKSTLLEAIAVACGFNPEGGTINFNFATKETHSSLSDYIRVTKGIKKAKDGFFFRAESFYNVASNIDDVGAINSYGGISLHDQSHGESFMSLIMNRFQGEGIYIMDEPEAALSPTRQMALISRIHDLVGRNSQFIIATHSPIIMAYPEAVIYNIEDGYKKIDYKDTEHYQVVKSFVNNTEQMLKILMED